MREAEVPTFWVRIYGSMSPEKTLWISKIG